MLKIRSWSARLALAGLAVLLGGCVGMMREPPPEIAAGLATPPPESAPVETWLVYLDRLTRMRAPELAAEHQRALAGLDGERAGALPPRLAGLLAMPGAPFRDEATAERLLREWQGLRPDVDAALRALVVWQLGQLAERIRLAGAVEEGLRKSREERRRAEACGEKLEAIRNMEKSLLERDKH